MKNKTIAIMTTACLGISMASCSGDEPNTGTGNYPEDNVVRMSVGVSQHASRTTFTNDNLTDFGISIQSSKGTSNAKNYNNVRVTGSCATGWTSESRMLWENKLNEETIIAYAPYNASMPDRLVTQTAVPISVGSDQSSANDRSDFLYFKRTKFVPQNDLNADGKIDIVFNHLLSKVDILVTFGGEFEQSAPLTANPISKITLNGSKLEGTADFTTEGMATVTVKTDASEQNIIPTYDNFASVTENGATHKQSRYSCILVPQTTGLYLRFEADGTIYVWQGKDLVLESGKRYELKLFVGKDVALIGEISAKPWVDGGDQDIKTN